MATKIPSHLRVLGFGTGTCLLSFAVLVLGYRLATGSLTFGW